MSNVQRYLEKFKLTCPVQFDQPLREFTTFQVGGPADVLARPRTEAQLQEILSAVRGEETPGEDPIPLWVLGGGANIVVSDAGIRGVVVYLGDLADISSSGSVVSAQAGAAISDVAAYAADRSLQGLEFIYAMPGSVGGAVWMNARCYGGEIFPVLRRVHYVTRSGKAGTYTPRQEDFGYKISPFQDGTRIITTVEFGLTAAPGQRDSLWRIMREHEADRRSKGHFAYPCAGSIFKNDRAFGQPSGRIIDEQGLRGLTRGGARVSEQHGNIIVNTGGATASDIRELVMDVQTRVLEATGYHLDPEVLFVGDWS
ncbi:MAG: UDP-N-acetylmuramate dehydrogenase [Alkalispirochaeta sp.]